MQTIISRDKVRELLPQKEPIVMVHDLLQYEEEEVLTSLLIEEENIFCQNGVLSESGLIENFAQSIALHTGYGFYLRKEEAPVGYIGTIDRLKIEALPRLGERIQTRVRIVQEFMGITLVEGETLRDGEVIMTARMKTFIAEETPAN